MFLILWKITQQVVSQFVLNTKRISTQPSYPQEFCSVRFGFTKVRTDPITAMLYKLSIFYEPFLKSLLLNRLMQSIQTKECLRMMME
jgi:hypothetical protein